MGLRTNPGKRILGPKKEQSLRRMSLCAKHFMLKHGSLLRLYYLSRNHDWGLKHKEDLVITSVPDRE